MVEGRVNTVAVEDLQTQPVAVSSGMAPSQAPVVADTTGGLRVGSSGVSLSSAPTTGIGGANTGNANTGGMQVQNVTVQANPEAKASNMSSVNSDYERAEMLRQRRVRSEVENETRLLEKLEEGRLADERARQGNIEGYYSSVAGSASATATAIGQNPTAVAVANNTQQVETVPVVATGVMTEVDTNHGGEFLGMSSFALTPFAGYSWIDDDSMYYSSQNRITAGLNFEGKFNRYLSFEGAFTYGYDKFYERGYYGGPGMNSRDTFEATAGLKASFQATEKLRPFIAGSAGGKLSLYNIDDYYTSEALEMAGLQRSTINFIGNIGGGLDYAVAHNFTIGSRFDYQGVFNQEPTSMDAIWDDKAGRFRLLGTLQLVF